MVVGIITSTSALTKEKKQKSVKNFSPQRVDLTWTQLPISYKASRPEEYVEWLGKIAESGPEIDQFSTVDDKKQHEQYIQNKASENQPVGLALSTSIKEDAFPACLLKYDPNEQMLSYSLTDSRYIEYVHIRRDTDGKRKVIFESITKDKRDKAGTNKFGAEYTFTSLKNLDISIPMDNSMPPTRLFLSPKEARDIAPKLKCVVFFSGLPPYYTKDWSTKAATADNLLEISTEENILSGQIEDIWLIDTSTRKILKKYSE